MSVFYLFKDAFKYTYQPTVLDIPIKLLVNANISSFDGSNAVHLGMYKIR